MFPIENHYILVFVLKEEFEDTKGVIRIRISKKNRKHNGQKKRYKRTNNNLQNIQHTHQTKDRVTRTPLKTGGELRCSGRVSSSCSTSGTRCVNLVTNPVRTVGKIFNQVNPGPQLHFKIYFLQSSHNEFSVSIKEHQVVFKINFHWVIINSSAKVRFKHVSVIYVFYLPSIHYNQQKQNHSKLGEPGKNGVIFLLILLDFYFLLS